jgi:hypothetical protein
MCRAVGISLGLYIQHIDKANAFLPAEKRRILEAVRDGQAEETQASVTT